MSQRFAPDFVPDSRQIFVSSLGKILYPRWIHSHLIAQPAINQNFTEIESSDTIINATMNQPQANNNTEDDARLASIGIFLTSHLFLRGTGPGIVHSGQATKDLRSEMRLLCAQCLFRHHPGLNIIRYPSGRVYVQGFDVHFPKTNKIIRHLIPDSVYGVNTTDPVVYNVE